MDMRQVDLQKIDGICRRFGVQRLDVFGSVARGEASSASDIDLLYDLAPGRSLGWEIEDLSEELSAAIGRPVDLISRGSVHPLLRARVLADARPFYAAA